MTKESKLWCLASLKYLTFIFLGINGVKYTFFFFFLLYNIYLQMQSLFSFLFTYFSVFSLTATTSSNFEKKSKHGSPSGWNFRKLPRCLVAGR